MLDVKELFNELKDNLFYPALIYISKNVITEYSRNFDKSILLNYESVFDKVIYVEDPAQTFFITTTSAQTRLSSKKNNLNENIFDLLSYEEQLTKEFFRFLIQKYGQLAYTYTLISQLICEQIDNIQYDTIVKHWRPQFILQEYHYKNHYNELRKSFPNIHLDFQVDIDLIEELTNQTYHDLEVSENNVKRKKKKKDKIISDV